MMKSALICLVSILLISCSGEKTVLGVYESKDGKEITIDCDYRIYSAQLTGQPFMPKSGDKITLIQTEINDPELELSYMMDGKMFSTFGKWDKGADELNINGVSYVRKTETHCK